MISPLGRAIVKTISYADVFNYPLRIEEIWRRLIKIKNKKSNIKNTIKKLKIIKQKDSYYYLKNRNEIIILRKKREKWSREKIKIAEKIAKFLKLIPTVKLVGVTGGLAVDNADRNDDIDLYIIASKGTLWMTRLFTTLVLELVGDRRRPNDRNVRNKICLNMFVEECHLGIPKNERDLFSAHEVVQMKPIFERGNIYSKFLQANEWVKEYLPNYYFSIEQSSNRAIKKKSRPLFNCSIVKLLNLVETSLKKFQLWYMRNRRTTEVIKNGVIRFHPEDARVWVMEKYKERLMKNKLV